MLEKHPSLALVISAAFIIAIVIDPPGVAMTVIYLLLSAGFGFIGWRGLRQRR